MYRRIGESIVDAGGRVVMTLTCPRWDATLDFELKVRNGLIVPRWDGDTLIWIPAEARA